MSEIQSCHSNQQFNFKEKAITTLDSSNESDEIIKTLENFLINDNGQLILPPLDFDSRVRVHKWCEDRNIHSFSKGKGDERYMVIEKQKRRFTVNDSDLLEFIRENKFPIQVIQLPYLDYFLDLYEKDFQTRTKYNDFVELLKELSRRHTNFKSYRKDLMDTGSEKIRNGPAYQDFLQIKLPDVTLNVKSANLYTCNAGETEYFISLDIRKANYTSYRCFYPEIVYNTKTWEEFMSQMTDLDYFINSKLLRQIIFGKLNMSRNAQLWKRMTARLIEVFKQHPEITIAGKISDDELIILTTKDKLDSDFALINTILEDSLSDFADCWRVTRLSVKCFAVNKSFHKYYIKTNYESGCEEIKNCDIEHYAQLYKLYKGEKITDYDKKVMVAGDIATFDKDLEVTLY
jgi:hypothetical protein